MKMNKKKKAAILAAAMSLGIGSQVSAMERVPIIWNGKQIFDVQYYDADEGNNDPIGLLSRLSGGNTFIYNLTPEIKIGLNRAFKKLFSQRKNGRLKL